MAEFILKAGFEHENEQVFFTLALLDDAGREIHAERLSLSLNANAIAVDATVQAAANRFPSVRVEDLIRDAVKGLTP